MTRMTLILAVLAAPAMATEHVAGSSFPVEDDPMATDEIAITECNETSDGAVACVVDAEVMGMRDPTFCLAIGEDGEALANSTGATDDGLVLFQEVEAADIAALRCRPV